MKQANWVYIPVAACRGVWSWRSYSKGCCCWLSTSLNVHWKWIRLSFSAAGFEEKMIIITVLVCQSSTELRKTPATTCWACEDYLVFVARSSCFWLTYCKCLKIQADLAYHCRIKLIFVKQLNTHVVTWITGHGINGIFASAPGGSISRGVAWVLNIGHILQKQQKQ